METIKLQIQSQSDREGIVLALANSGYKVWVEVEEDCLIGSSYYVIFEYDKTNPKI